MGKLEFLKWSSLDNYTFYENVGGESGVESLVSPQVIACTNFGAQGDPIWPALLFHAVHLNTQDSTHNLQVTTSMFILS